MSPSIKPIQTCYKGYRFRSRLEARWAVFFDSLNIPWVYEPEGLEIKGIHYLPDFYLPDCNQFFEVKGVLKQADNNKVSALIDAGYSITLGYDDGRFTACDLWGEYDAGKRVFGLCDGNTSLLCRCTDCGKCWFMGNAGSYKCQCCGAYAGDGHFNVLMEHYDFINQNKHYEGGNTSLWDVARRARFEHGENPTIQGGQKG